MVFEGSDFKVHLHADFDERAEWEMSARGYLSHATVELAAGQRYPVCFYDPVRLRQDVEMGAKSGEPCVAEPGLIVVPQVTREEIIRAVEYLADTGYFSHLVPLENEVYNGAPTGSAE